MSYQGVPEDKPHLGGWGDGHDASGTWVPEVWAKIIKDLGIESMTDIGCGAGETVLWFRRAGVSAIGIDGVSVDRQDGGIVHDYTTGPRLVAETDLAWSAEFVEHVDEEFVPNFIPTFRCHRYVALSAALPGDSGHHHVNCRPSAYWISKLSDAGFEYFPEYTKALKKVCPFGALRARCVRANLLFFRRRDGS